MKKMICLIISLILLATLLPACGSQEETATADDAAQAEEQSREDQTADQQSQEDQAAGDQTADTQQAGSGQSNVPEQIDLSQTAGNGADVDITKYSSTMMYSAVYDLVSRPDEYMGKKIRIIGLMSSFYMEETDKTYYACIIPDATACCSQGIEFITTDDIDPADYPEDNSIITVLGTYDLYEENGSKYCVLKDAVFE